MAKRQVRQFNVYLPPELITAVKHHAVDTEQSLSSIVEAALEAFLRTTTEEEAQDDD